VELVVFNKKVIKDWVRNKKQVRKIQPDKDPKLEKGLAGWRADFFVREAHEVVKE